MSGIATLEGGLAYLLDLEAGFVFTGDYIRNDLETLVFNFTMLEGELLSQVTGLVYDLYFSDVDLDDTPAVQYAVQLFMSDTLSGVNLNEIMAALPKGEDDPPLWSYMFTYEGEFRSDPLINVSTHDDEVTYLFDLLIYDDGVLNAADQVISERLLTLWTTFAKTGNPNPTSGDVIYETWEPVTSSDSLPYFNISSDLGMGVDYNLDRITYWRENILPLVYNSTGFGPP